MTTAERLELIHLVAVLYYTANKTQNEIAEELSVSRQTVSRLLSQAREEGIVKITITNPFASMELLADSLQKVLNLSTVIVIPGKDGSQAQIRRHLGYAAARYLETAIRTGDTVGIGWGRTLFEVMGALNGDGGKGLTVAPLLGGLNHIAPSFQVHEMARIFSEKLGGVWKPFYVPAIVANEALRQSLFDSLDVKQIMESWKNLNAVLVGIGDIDLGPDVHMLFAAYMDDNRMSHLKQADAVGDICMRFFDIQGIPIAEGLPGVVGIELAEIRRARLRIGVAGGAEKAKAIIGAARGGFINTLVTDESAASRIINLLS
jgi:DNA-binding transcriptional regulator LsrR (DeoR family)